MGRFGGIVKMLINVGGAMLKFMLMILLCDIWGRFVGIVNMYCV